MPVSRSFFLPATNEHAKDLNIYPVTLSDAAPCTVIMSGAVLWCQQAAGEDS